MIFIYDIWYDIYFICRENGLLLLPTAQYIGTSPDGLISCSCCGSGVLEIKCPLTLADKDPAVEHPKYITKDGSNCILNQNHLYYSQV